MRTTPDIPAERKRYEEWLKRAGPFTDGTADGEAVREVLEERTWQAWQAAVMPRHRSKDAT